MTMVETIARALCRARYNGPPEMYPVGWVDERININWSHFVGDAKTVLLAIREPTDAMVLVIPGGTAGQDQFDLCKKHWAMMIDEALK